MALPSGMTLGPYRIVAPLGAGGMGEVYRARDTRLERDVALKVLPAELAGDAERRRRFEQEARHASSLNHPNIVGIYDVGAENDCFFVVMELVDGESLRALIQRGPVPARKLLDVAVQMADGLAAAHAAGIVHRDLKPENVMLTRDGRVKLLDFGLAKQAEPALAATADATQVSSGTQPGTVLGTCCYMSPEQARGVPVDFRSDLFSFGLLLYEMAAGKKAFERDSAVQTLSAIIGEETAPLEARLPPPLKWTIDRCLAKEPQERHDSTRDLHRELRYLRDHLSETLTTTTETLRAPKHRTLRLTWPRIAALAGILIAGILLGLWLAPASGVDMTRYRLTPLATERLSQSNPVWSPDGRSVAFVARVGDTSQLFLRAMDTPVPLQLTRLKSSVRMPFWSADSRRVLFVSGEKPAGIWAVSQAGGDPEPLQAGERILTASLSPDGKTLATLEYRGPGNVEVWLASPPGSTPRKYEPQPFVAHGVYNRPQMAFSPNGKKLLLLIRGDQEEQRWLLSFPPGSGKARRVLQRVNSAFTPSFSWMPDSRHVVVSSSASAEEPSRLWLADTAGDSIKALTAGLDDSVQPAVAPDGRRLAFTASLTDLDLVEIPLAGGPARPLIATSRSEYMPSWSEKGLAFITDRTGQQQIWMRGRNEDWERPIVTARDFQAAGQQVTVFMGPALSPDGTRIAYSARIGEKIDIWISPVSGGVPTRLTSDNADFEGAPCWSPDGNWIVYLAVKTGKEYLLKARVGSQAQPTVLRDDASPSVAEWSPAGDWIAARLADGKWTLISPDGRNTRSLGFSQTAAIVFSKDAKTLYGLRRENQQAILFAIDVQSGKDRTIGPVGDILPGAPLNPGVRFALSPDGKSFATGVVKPRSDIWMLEGIEAPGGLLARLGLRR